MSDKINIIQLVGKHSPLLAAAIEHSKSTEVYGENIKAAIKEIVEAVIDKCAEEAKKDILNYDGFGKDGIINVKDMISYGTN